MADDFNGKWAEQKFKEDLVGLVTAIRFDLRAIRETLEVVVKAIRESGQEDAPQ